MPSPPRLAQRSPQRSPSSGVVHSGIGPDRSSLRWSTPFADWRTQASTCGSLLYASVHERFRDLERSPTRLYLSPRARRVPEGAMMTRVVEVETAQGPVPGGSFTQPHRLESMSIDPVAPFRSRTATTSGGAPKSHATLRGFHPGPAMWSSDAPASIRACSTFGCTFSAAATCSTFARAPGDRSQLLKAHQSCTDAPFRISTRTTSGVAGELRGHADRGLQIVVPSGHIASGPYARAYIFRARSREKVLRVPVGAGVGSRPLALWHHRRLQQTSGSRGIVS